MAQRPTKKTPEVIQRLLDGLADGVTLRALCREEGMPNWRTVYDWIEADADIAARFERAREIGFDAIAEDVFDIADDGTNDWVERERKDGSTDIVLNGEHVQRSKLRIETRMKLLAKWHPKKYGEKQDVNIGNKEGETLQIDNGVDTVALTLKIAEALRMRNNDK
jgi:predicted secreted protein